MMTDFNAAGDMGGEPSRIEVPELVNGAAGDAAEVPTVIEVIDGRDVLVIGDVQEAADFSHPQGDNPYGYEGTCGLCSCENILDSFGVEVSEADIVDYAIGNDLCYEGDDPSMGDDPGMLGGTTTDDQAQILIDHGIPAHAEAGGTLEDLAANIENGHGVIAEVDAGVLWDDPSAYGYGQSNHAITVSGVVRDPSTGAVEGFYVNDTGTGEAGKFYDAATFETAWVETGGTCVVTDVVRA